MTDRPEDQQAEYHREDHPEDEYWALQAVLSGSLINHPVFAFDQLKMDRLLRALHVLDPNPPEAPWLADV